MRVIVCPHELAMGGSQINAIELAASIRDRGNEVVLYAPNGELSQKVMELGLNQVRSPIGTRLSLAWVRGLKKLARDFDPDIVHTYEWATSVSAAYGFGSIGRASQVMTVLSMDVPKFLPSHLQLTVGTNLLAASLDRTAAVSVIEPPIDTVANRTVDAGAARCRIGASKEDLIVSIVCRMTNELDKANGVFSAIESIDDLAKHIPVRLLLVGDGPELARITNYADTVNRKHGKTVIESTGSILDPGYIYEGSDVVLGMGSSVLRGMAYGKPVVVQGTDGYWKLLSPSTLEVFLHNGFFGNGGAGASALRPILRDLLENPVMRSELGAWDRGVVESRFSLDAATDRLERIYRDVKAEPHRIGRTMLSNVRSMTGLAKFRVMRGAKNLKYRVASNA